ncbi:MAG: arsenate reductase (glutaredoxin) [Rhodocyclaceae bacterium]
MTQPVRIYHNPRCSKSRGACALLEELGVQAEVRHYLDNPPDKDELRALVAALGIRPGELVRRGEAVFKAQYAGLTLGDEEWLEALAAHPILIERPIVVVGSRAVVARPPERLRELFEPAG